jgi:8-oxo-dGTP pyrophosphatase MutT (NUDIX family)
MHSNPRPRPWQVVHTEPAADYHIFKARVDTSRSPRSGQLHRFVVLDTPDWVNVVALTREERVVLVRQFRHGLQDLSLEIPGGLIDPGESAEEAARRELLEETGYAAQRWERLGLVHPNPAFQNNRCMTFLALGCERVAEPAPDATEDIGVELCPASELAELVSSGQITHSLVLNALYWFLYERGRSRDRPAPCT